MALRRCFKGSRTAGVHAPHAPHVAVEVAIVDEVGQHRLRQRIGVARGQRGGADERVDHLPGQGNEGQPDRRGQQLAEGAGLRLERVVDASVMRSGSIVCERTGSIHQASLAPEYAHRQPRLPRNELVGLPLHAYSQPKYVTCLDLGPWGFPDAGRPAPALRLISLMILEQ